MKLPPPLIISLCLILFYSSVHSQTDCITGDCTKDFTQKFYNIDSNKSYTYFSTQEQTNGFPDLGDVYYHKVVVTTTTPNKTDELCNTDPDNCLHDGAAFKYYAYYPIKSVATGLSFDYSTCKPPAIILFHGGGFSDCATLDADEITFLCRGFARRGYVVFDVEYRSGRLVDPNHGSNVTKYVTAQQSLAIYRAMQDARGAIRSIIQRQLDQNAHGVTSPFAFDANSIFLGGTSAGSIIALSVAYTPGPGKIAQIFPAASSSLAIASVLGPINAPYYYGPTSINIISRIKGVLNCWGEVFFPLSYDGIEASFLDNTINIPPMIAFHGEADDVNYIGKNKLKFAPTGYMPYPPNYPDLNSTNFCTISSQTYTLENSSTPQLISEGSYGMYNILKSLGKKVELYVDCDMKHGIQDYTRDNFGISATSDDDVLQYIVQRGTTFFQAVLSSSVGGLNRDLFVGCVNYRIKCDTPQSLADNPSTTTCPDATCLQGVPY